MLRAFMAAGPCRRQHETHMQLDQLLLPAGGGCARGARKTLIQRESLEAAYASGSCEHNSAAIWQGLHSAGLS